MRGYEVSRRTIERDLEGLLECMPLELNHGERPQRWRWQRARGLDVPGMEAAEAMSRYMMQDAITTHLPSCFIDALHTRFAQANKTLVALARNGSKLRWSDRVRVVPANVVLKAPRIGRKILRTLETALLNDIAIGFVYQSLQGSAPTRHPDPPRWEARLSTPDGRCDAQVDIVVAGKALTLVIEAKKTVYPRDVHQVLGQRGRFGPDHSTGSPSADQIAIVVADAISPGAKDLLRNERVGYYDRGGSLFLPARCVYLYIDKPPPKTLAKSLRSIFSGRRAKVLHTLLARSREWFNGKEVADEAHVSQATASEVLTELERFDWVISRGQGPGKERNLKDPAGLLDDWVKQLESARAPILRRFYVPSLKADQLLEPIGRIFGRHDVDYAISYEAAAQCYAPFLSTVSQIRARLVPGPAVDSALSDLDARIVTEGANFAVIEAKSTGELLFREHVAGAWLASPVQVYLDLLRGEGRAKEMAEHLRKEKIGF